MTPSMRGCFPSMRFSNGLSSFTRMFFFANGLNTVRSSTMEIVSNRPTASHSFDLTHPNGSMNRMNAARLISVTSRRALQMRQIPNANRPSSPPPMEKT